MAMRCSSFPAKIIQFSPARATARATARARGSLKSRVFMIHNSKTTIAQKPLSVQIVRHSPTNKVFEDQSKGIICYKDDDGELICEGFDDEEGPCPSPQVPTPTAYYRSWNSGSPSKPKQLSNVPR